MFIVWTRREFEQKLTKTAKEKNVAPAAYSPLAPLRASVQNFHLGFGYAGLCKDSVWVSDADRDKKGNMMQKNSTKKSVFKSSRNASWVRCMVVVFLFLGMLSIPIHGQAAKPDSCFLKNKDRWLFVGDSITNADIYRQLLLRVLQFYHPDADIMVGNSGVAGVTSDYQEKRDFTPTVVTIMLGMNDVIHQDHAFTPDLTEKLNGYRDAITQKVQSYQKLGATVILMTPTYTDERFSSYFNIASTRRFLEAFGTVIREIAQKEKCEWIPVAEELEAFQDAQPADRLLRIDGVHPNGLGQYQIARSLWQHMNFAGPLNGVRKIVAPSPELPVTARLVSRFMHSPSEGITFELRADKKREVMVRWSMDKARGEEKLSVGPDPIQWKPAVPEVVLTVPLGDQRKLVMEFSEGTQKHLCVIDLGRTRVLKLVNGTVSGEIMAKEERPEGKLVARWKLEEMGNDVCFSGEVLDTEIVKTPMWPFMRDGLQLWLDLRPATRFADINPDRDVADLMLSARDTPYFSITPLAWISPRLMYAVAAGGERTATGYTWHCVIGGNVSDVRTIGVGALDYYGFNLIVCDNDAVKNPGVHYYPAQENQCIDPVESINRLIIVDRKGKFPNPETTTLHLFQ